MLTEASRAEVNEGDERCWVDEAFWTAIGETITVAPRDLDLL